MSTEHAGDELEPSEPVAAAGAGNRPTVVVTAMALKRAAQEELAHRLGPGHVVVDIRDADATADIVLIPPASGQLVGAIRRTFPNARVLLTEFTDVDYGADFGGPVLQSIESGVDGYFVVPTMEKLAALTHQVASGQRSVGALTGGDRANDGRSAPPNLTARLDTDSDLAPSIRIDLWEWADEVGMDSQMLMRFARPLLDQLRRQSVDVTLVGIDDLDDQPVDNR